MAVISNALIAVGFPTMHGADEVMLKLAKAAEDDLVELEDAAVVVRNRAGTFRIRQSADMATQGLVGGSFTGLLVGSLLLHPAAGIAGVVTVGIDTPSLDRFSSVDLEAHHAAADRGMTWIEGLRLDGVEAGAYLFVGLPMPLFGTEAAPVRALVKRIEESALDTRPPK